MEGNRTVLTTVLALALAAAAGLSVSASVMDGVEATGIPKVPPESVSDGLLAGELKLAVTWAGEIKEDVQPVLLGSHMATDPISRTVSLSRTGQITHPVGLALATHFDVPYDEIMDWHELGLGFGGIVKAYSIAALLGDGMTVEDLFNLKLMGAGWGRIFKDLELSPSSRDRGLGKVMSGQKQGGGHEADDVSVESGVGQGRGAGAGTRWEKATGQDKTPPGQNKHNQPPGQEEGGRGNGAGNGKGGGKR
jgi:hypothetical protein